VLKSRRVCVASCHVTHISSSCWRRCRASSRAGRSADLLITPLSPKSASEDRNNADAWQHPDTGPGVKDPCQMHFLRTCLQEDLQFEGPVIAFSWASLGGRSRRDADARRCRTGQPAAAGLAELLGQLMSQVGSRKWHVKSRDPSSLELSRQASLSCCCKLIAVACAGRACEQLRGHWQVCMALPDSNAVLRHVSQAECLPCSPCAWPFCMATMPQRAHPTCFQLPVG